MCFSFRSYAKCNQQSLDEYIVYMKMSLTHGINLNEEKGEQRQYESRRKPSILFYEQDQSGSFVLENFAVQRLLRVK